MPAFASMDAAERRQLFWFFALALLVLGAGYGLRDPWPADEPRFVLVAKQMVDSGQWLFPHRGHELYPDKPPLFFWLLAVSHQLIGSWRWSFLLPSLLSGLGTLWLTYDLGRRLWHHRAGLWAAIAVLSAFQFVYQFKRAQIDPTLVFFTTLALYGLCRHLLLGPHWRWFWAGCFAAGLGVVLKGVGFLPLLILLPFALMQRGRWQGLAPLGSGNGWRWSVGALAFLAAIALWLLPMVFVALSSGDPEHRAYLDNLLFKQTATRYANAWHHRQPLWYFVEVIGLQWLPFSLAFLWLWRDWRDAWRARNARVWLPLSWALIVVAFFSASPGKRDMYVLPVLPAMALAAGPFLAEILNRNLRATLPQLLARLLDRLTVARLLLAATRCRHLLLFAALALSAALLGLGLAMLFGESGFESRLIADRGLDPQLVRGLALALAGVGAIGLIACAIARVRRAELAMAVVLVMLWCSYGFVAHPVLDPSNSASALMRHARELAGPDTAIGLVEWKEQNLLQAVGPTEEFGFRQPAAEQLRRAVSWLEQAPGSRRLLLSQPRARLPCFGGAGSAVEMVGTANRRDWYLVARPAISERCFAATPEDVAP